VMRALAHEPAQRFQTAAEMGNALEELMRKLQIVTTHAQVGGFVQKLLGDKIEARQQLIATAISEASNRERVREALTVPIDIDTQESDSSLRHGVVAVPTAILSTEQLGDSARLQLGSAPDGGTAGTFVATAVTKTKKPRWPLAVGLLLGVLGLVGAGLVGFSLKSRNDRNARAAIPVATTAAAAATHAAPPTAVTDLPPAPTAVNELPAASGGTQAAQAPSASATPPNGHPGHAAARGWAPAPKAQPSATASAKASTPTAPQKKQDDEAGF
jgi:hypothetical protein